MLQEFDVFFQSLAIRIAFLRADGRYHDAWSDESRKLIDVAKEKIHDPKLSLSEIAYGLG
ncbi:MAG: hypothetical protein RL688_1625, partial [Actinomycetota bacterium]